MAWGISDVYTPPNLMPAPTANNVPAGNAFPNRNNWMVDANGNPANSGQGLGGFSKSYGGLGGASSAGNTPAPAPVDPLAQYGGREGLFNYQAQLAKNNQTYLQNKVANASIPNSNQSNNSLSNMLAQFYTMMQKQNTINTLTPQMQAYNAVNGPNAVKFVPTPGYGNNYQPVGTPPLYATRPGDDLINLYHRIT